jgi:hypothetical protein
MSEMEEIAHVAPFLFGKGLQRFEKALSLRRKAETLNRHEAERELKILLAEAGAESSFELVA